MPLIKRNGAGWSMGQDEFTAVADGDTAPDGAICVSLARFQAERDVLLIRNAPLAVRLSADQSPEALGGDVHRLAAVFLTFPKFRDGRGYSWARLLRQRLGYGGEIRATGEALRDQWLFMQRCGVTAFEVRDGTQLSAFHCALGEQTVFLQPAADGRGGLERAAATPIARSVAA